MRYGPLDRRVSILRKQITLSASGDSIETWTPVVLTAWASLKPVRGDERFSSDQFIASEQSEFRLRWSGAVADLSPLDRIVQPALRLSEIEGSPPSFVTDASIADRRQYDIMAVHELGRREGVQVLAARRVDTIELEEEVPVVDTPGSTMFGAHYFGRRYFGGRYFGAGA